MSQRPRIVQCCREMSEGGGVSGVARHLEAGFGAAGYDCDRVTLATVGLTPRPLHRSRLVNKLVHIRDVLWYSVAATVYTRLRYRGRDVVIINHSDSVHGDIFISHGLHKRMIRTAPHPVGMLLRNPLHLFILAREELRHRLHLYHAVVTLCGQDAADIVRYFPSTRGRVVQLSNGVDWERFARAGAKRPALRRTLGVAVDEVILLFVGNEFERKGLAAAMAALAELDRRHRLWVVGGDESMIAAAAHAARQLGVAERIRFLGTRTEGVADLFGAADLFVLPSSHEAMPLVLLEAMAAGAVPVVTRFGAAVDLVTPGENGYLVDRTAVSIAAAVREATRTPDVLAERRQAAVETARGYDWAMVVQRYLALVNAVHATRQRPRRSWRRPAMRAGDHGRNSSTVSPA
jgi:glycosyltransferase involved in cell wall biosynthesis